MVFRLDYVKHCKKQINKIEKEYLELIKILKYQEIDANKLVKGVYNIQSGIRQIREVLSEAKNAKQADYEDFDRY